MKLYYFLFSFLFCFGGVFASEGVQGYIVQVADGRSFLLDTETGATWRYFFNSVGEQGWSRVYFMSLGEDSNSVSLVPYGVPFEVPKDKKIVK